MFHQRDALLIMGSIGLLVRTPQIALKPFQTIACQNQHPQNTVHADNISLSWLLYTSLGASTMQDRHGDSHRSLELRYQRIVAHWTRWVGVATIAMMVSTFAGLAVALYQSHLALDESRRARQEFLEQRRPVLTMAQEDPIWVRVLQREATSVDYAFKILVQNVGPSTAKNVRTVMGACVQPCIPPTPEQLAKKTSNVKRTEMIGPSSRSGELYHIPISDVLAAYDRHSQIAVWYYAQYEESGAPFRKYALGYCISFRPAAPSRLLKKFPKVGR
jgi:hypothetical protein